MLKLSTDTLLLDKLNKEGAGTRRLGFKHVDDVMTYSSKEFDVMMMLQGADVFAKNWSKPSPYHSVSFYKYVHLFFSGLTAGSRIAYRMFKLLLPCLPGSRSADIAIKQHFYQGTGFRYDAPTKYQCS